MKGEATAAGVDSIGRQEKLGLIRGCRGGGVLVLMEGRGTEEEKTNPGGLQACQGQGAQCQRPQSSL